MRVTSLHPFTCAFNPAGRLTVGMLGHQSYIVSGTRPLQARLSKPLIWSSLVQPALSPARDDLLLALGYSAPGLLNIGRTARLNAASYSTVYTNYRGMYSKAQRVVCYGKRWK